ncbi:hypothetical protein BD779DRAFT_1450168 [Infundibulicybe gibba]|nr:hypothetical protein BD779DRAFT_1450168 [Infundibulicybe gibba]
MRNQEAPSPPVKRRAPTRTIVSTLENPPNTNQKSGDFLFLKTHSCSCASASSLHEKHCAVLEYFDLYYRSDLNLIICYTHGCAVLLDSWKSHLKSHSSAPRALERQGKELNAMKAHVEESFRPATSLANLHLPSALLDVLPMMKLYGDRPSILPRYPCPVSECKQWLCISVNKTTGYEHEVNKHLKSAHEKSMKDFPQRSKTPQWTQSLRLATNPHRYHYFTLPAGFQPLPNIPVAYPSHMRSQVCVEKPKEPVTELLVPASWMHDLGWHAYRSSFSQESCMSLRGLLSIPNPKGLNYHSGSMKWLESGLWLIFTLTPKYLENANTYLGYCHPDVRKSVTIGSQSGYFRTITPHRYKQYGNILSQATAMTLRIIHDKIQPHQQYHSSLWCKCTRRQLEAAIALYRVIVEGQGSLVEEDVLPAMHEFFDTLLRSGALANEPIATPTDLLFFILSIRPGGAYATASTVASDCAALRYCFNSIFVHIARCKKLGSHSFSWFEAPLGPEATQQGQGHGHEEGTMEDMVEDDTGGEDTGEEDTAGEDTVEEVAAEDLEAVLKSIMAGENLVITLFNSTTKTDRIGTFDYDRDDNFVNVHELDRGVSKSIMESMPEIEETTTSILAFMSDEQSWVTTKDEHGRSTPFSRLHRIWGRVHQSAMHQPGSMQFSSSGNGYTWQLARRGHVTQEVDMRAWALACESAMARFKDRIESLLISHSVDEFSSGIQIKDAKIRDSPHRQAQNVWVLEAQEQLFKTAITIDSGGKQDRHEYLKSWLETEQVALGHLACIACLGGGIPFRGWQLLSIRYDCSGAHDRNVWIIDDVIVLSHPRAKQRTTNFAPTLLAFPEQLSTPLAIYLYLVRPVACRILQFLGLDASLHATLVWVNSTIEGPHSALPWTSERISSCLQKFTKETMMLAVSPPVSRQVCQAVIRDKFPQLFSYTTIPSRLKEYAYQCEFPPWNDLDPETAVQIFAVSQIWQAMLGLGPTKHAWAQIVEGSHIFPMEATENWEIAFLRAAKLIQDIPLNTRDLIGSTTRLLQSQEMCAALVAPVLGHVIFGHNSSRVDIDLPLWGLHVEDVARAIQIIRVAATTRGPRLAGAAIKTLLDSCPTKTIYDQGLTDLRAFRDQNIYSWDRLGIEVYSLHCCPNLPVTGDEERSFVEALIHQLKTQS